MEVLKLETCAKRDFSVFFTVQSVQNVSELNFYSIYTRKSELSDLKCSTLSCQKKFSRMLPDITKAFI